MKENTASTVDRYLADFPPETKSLLNQLRETIKKAAPEAEEVISYQMPAYKFHGMLVYFAGCKNHIGFYPTSSGIANFKKELSTYKSSKGSVQFPLDQLLPLELIAEIVRFRVIWNLEREKEKRKKK